MHTIGHWIGRPTSGSPAGTAPVRDPATGVRQAEEVLRRSTHGPGGVGSYTRTEVATERWPARTAPSAAGHHSPTST